MDIFRANSLPCIPDAPPHVMVCWVFHSVFLALVLVGQGSWQVTQTFPVTYLFESVHAVTQYKHPPLHWKRKFPFCSVHHWHHMETHKTHNFSQPLLLKNSFNFHFLTDICGRCLYLSKSIASRSNQRGLCFHQGGQLQYSARDFPSWIPAGGSSSFSPLPCSRQNYHIFLCGRVL